VISVSAVFILHNAEVFSEIKITANFLQSHHVNIRMFVDKSTWTTRAGLTLGSVPSDEIFRPYLSNTLHTRNQFKIYLNCILQINFFCVIFYHFLRQHVRLIVSTFYFYNEESYGKFNFSLHFSFLIADGVKGNNKKLYPPSPPLLHYECIIVMYNFR
jgi:hypothetical protein